MMKLILLAGLLGMAAAECPDACNGHGFCGQFDKCSCYRNWMGNSCDKRTCPYDLAFVDVPAGDLNMDGSDEFKAANAATAHVAVTFGAQINNRKGYEVWPHDATETKEGGFDQAEDAHFYAECSNKGMCDRKSGLCSCFDGYEGTACRRVVCPNDCSGHGTCETMEEFTQAFHGAANFPYNLWDRYKAQVCKCDPGYFGIDCANRYCPRGDDPLTTDQHDETQWIDFNCDGAACSGTMTLSYIDTYGETWDTNPITVGNFDFVTAGNNVLFATRIATALKSIPNSVIEGVSVTVTSIEDVLPGFASHTADGNADADSWIFAFSNTGGSTVNKLVNQNVITKFGAGNDAAKAARYGVSNCGGSAVISFTAIVTDNGSAGDIFTVPDHADQYSATVCRVAKNGFRAKITFTKNPGNLNNLVVTTTATATVSVTDTPALLGAFGHLGSDAQANRITTNMDLTDSLAIGNRVAYGTSDVVYTVTSLATAPADKDTVGYFAVAETVPATSADPITAHATPAAMWYNRGTKELQECSHRGMCDHGAGVCECFNGYTNDDCGMQDDLRA
jgi:hypothetical protein